MLALRVNSGTVNKMVIDRALRSSAPGDETNSNQRGGMGAGMVSARLSLRAAPVALLNIAVSSSVVPRPLSLIRVQGTLDQSGERFRQQEKAAGLTPGGDVTTRERMGQRLRADAFNWTGARGIRFNPDRPRAVDLSPRGASKGPSTECRMPACGPKCQRTRRPAQSLLRRRC